MHLAQYVHLNPVMAGLCRSPEQWPYSNYLEWIGQRNGVLIDRDWVRHYFSMLELYIKFVNTQISTQMEEKMKPYLLEERP